ncbi:MULTISPECIES: methyltransferase domain-containing protein [unclassified Ruegeria]|uniref:methyltransferase domain-containing protein n=1 Tax=unclassified Ruegeria TaxID=2625375 RepID=UPI001ADD1A90|nr:MULTISPECIES: methyltransferase domain-containing protein [unclassified Ruegeria]MBO9411800.1 methyltransferase domain-containing protein [Ruegeria sp. R8_1]MBO9415639.1 methyltransferase domain-containing protein [Ruegeria sp. R8_2]
MKLPASNAPSLFDRKALTLHRARARDEALFLHRAAVDEVQDRLSMVNKTFMAPAVVTPFAHIWRDVMPKAQIVADDEVLNLTPGAHDLVIHALALHWANDPVGQLIQCHRALQPDGLLLVVCLGGETLHELRAALGQAEIEISGGLSPRIAPMGELRDLGGLLQRAGLALPVADTARLTAEYRDLRHLMQDLRAMGETNSLTDRIKRPTRRQVFDRAQKIYADHFATPEGRLNATYELICLTGWSPDDSQQKPLRPGSAQTRLAEALGTKEGKLTD